MLPKNRLIQWMSNYNLEVSAKEIKKIEQLSSRFPSGIKVYLPHIQGKSFQEEIIEPAIKLKKLGFIPVPHLAARNLKNQQELENYLEQMKEAADIQEILLLGGGINPPQGDFNSSLEMLQTGLFSKYDFKTIAVAGHPEKHPQVDEEELLKALKEKQDFVKEKGIHFYIITQFCFDIEPVIVWLDKLKNRKIQAPVRLGVVGLIGITSLIKYAIYCGVGNSLQVLKDKYKSITQLAMKYKTEEFFLPLLENLQENYTEVEGLHLFTFGSGEKTIDYFQQWKTKITQSV